MDGGDAGKIGGFKNRESVEVVCVVCERPKGEGDLKKKKERGGGRIGRGLSTAYNRPSDEDMALHARGGGAITLERR